MKKINAIVRLITQWALVWVDGVKYGLRLLWRFYQAIDRGGFWLVGVFLTVVTTVGFAISRMVGTYWPIISDFINTGSFRNFDAGIQIPGPLAQGLSFANSFFPLTELAIMLAGFIPFFVACALFRMVKAWIPTVN